MSETAPPLVSLRSALAALLVFGGAVHLVVAGHRASAWSLEAAALAAVGLTQLGLVVAVLLSDRRWPAVVVVVDVLAVAAWVWTRTVGYPFGPLEGQIPAIHALDTLVAATEIVAIGLAGGVLLTGGRILGPTGLRLDNLALVLVVAAGVPGLASSAWLDDVGTGGSASTHVHTVIGSGASDTMTTDDRVVLGAELAAARTAALELPTFGDAVRAGLVPSGEPATGVGIQVFDPSSSIEPGSFDPASPRAWIYASDDDGAPVIGVLYDSLGADAPEGFTGDTDSWHLHVGECVVGDGLAVPWDPVVTGDDCSDVDGARNDSLHWMLRAWIVDGWENPVSTFAHETPLVQVDG